MILRTYDVTFTLWGDATDVSYRVRAPNRSKAITAARLAHTARGGDVRDIDGISAIRF